MRKHRKLTTVYPHGLNDRLGDVLLSRNDRASRRTIYKNNSSFSLDESPIKLKHHLSQDFLDYPNFCRVSF